MFRIPKHDGKNKKNSGIHSCSHHLFLYAPEEGIAGSLTVKTKGSNPPPPPLPSPSTGPCSSSFFKSPTYWVFVKSSMPYWPLNYRAGDANVYHNVQEKSGVHVQYTPLPGNKKNGDKKSRYSETSGKKQQNTTKAHTQHMRKNIRRPIIWSSPFFSYYRCGGVLYGKKTVCPSCPACLSPGGRAEHRPPLRKNRKVLQTYLKNNYWGVSE